MALRLSEGLGVTARTRNSGFSLSVLEICLCQPWRLTMANLSTCECSKLHAASNPNVRAKAVLFFKSCCQLVGKKTNHQSSASDDRIQNGRVIRCNLAELKLAHPLMVHHRPSSGNLAQVPGENGLQRPNASCANPLAVPLPGVTVRRRSSGLLNRGCSCCARGPCDA